MTTEYGFRVKFPGDDRNLFLPLNYDEGGLGCTLLRNVVAESMPGSTVEPAYIKGLPAHLSPEIAGKMGITDHEVGSGTEMPWIVLSLPVNIVMTDLTPAEIQEFDKVVDEPPAMLIRFAGFDGDEECFDEMDDWDWEPDPEFDTKEEKAGEK